jgi:hypothetical protein
MVIECKYDFIYERISIDDCSLIHIDPKSLEGRNLPDYPSFIFDLFDMIIGSFDIQRQDLSSSMGIFNSIFQLIVHKGRQDSIVRTR